MIYIMHDDGYQVAPMATDALANSIGKDLRKEARELVFEQLMERHLSVDTPDQGEHDELIKKRTLSLDEQGPKLIRWDIEKDCRIGWRRRGGVKILFRQRPEKKCVCLKPCSWIRANRASP
ncbi:hypothetical protein ACKU5V_027180 [Klebsiella pneumoniae]